MANACDFRKALDPRSHPARHVLSVQRLGLQRLGVENVQTEQLDFVERCAGPALSF